MIRVVIESPYAGNIERNVAYARECLANCLKRGEAPIASHLLYTQSGVLDDSDVAQRRQGIEAGLEWGRLADKIVFYTDLGWSQGMIEAEQFYRRQGLGDRIEYRNDFDRAKRYLTGE